VKIEETKVEIEKTGTVFVRAKEAADVIQDFEEMLYGGEGENDEEDEGLAYVIERLCEEKVRIARDLADCLDGMEGDGDRR
jgi:hypothetical protein